MADPNVELERLIKAQKGSLVRRTKHKVYKFPEGQILVVASTPGDTRGSQNALAEAKRLLKVGVPSKKRKGRVQPKKSLAKRKKRVASFKFTFINPTPVKSWKEDLVKYLGESDR